MTETVDDVREAAETVPTPWPGLTPLADLSFRHKAGIVAQRGSREAKVGRDIAVHAARAGTPVVLFTGYPPATRPASLFIDMTPTPTAAHINLSAQRLIAGRKPRLIVIERFERLSQDTPEPQWDDAPGDPVEDPASESWGDRLMWTVRDIRVEIPTLFTTVVDPVPDLTRPLFKWLDVDHPAMVMTDVCKPTLVVARTGPEAVEGRLEVDPLAFRTGSVFTLKWAPLATQTR
ncbi:hypothetical protein [Streptomyces sp. MST-110588]|uniref:hypothetical protein n=1 Tax=Streptomyces sp. MST-110588 TaxID=2833628 RepID=UPI001F5E26A1|nr:hypothetical protein [Streptomyces sp. MST-110588]UNO38360.1 hypothetical protein KGS77_00195 [Streptomyces sp. MST-110588]